MKIKNHKMEKLTLKELAGYLPYELDFILTSDKSDEFECEDYYQEDLFKKESIWTLCGYAPGDLNIYLGEGVFDGFLFRNGRTYCNFYCEIKPILYPLSMLTQEIEHNGEKFVPKEWLRTNYIGESIGSNTATWSNRTILKLYEWHFDIHNLIGRGLAIDKTTIK